jgi:hypothetical protein
MFTPAPDMRDSTNQTRAEQEPAAGGTAADRRMFIK